MKTFRRNLAIAGLLIGLLCAAAPAGAATSATVNVTITVLPYASVTLSQEGPLTVTIGPQETSWSVAVGGTVVCNCPVSLSAAIASVQPGAAPGWTWSAATNVTQISTPGINVYTSLLTVSGGGSALAAGSSFSLTFTGQGLPKGPTPAPPTAGNVVVTVMPQ